jgi:hypothetical protein
LVIQTLTVAVTLLINSRRGVVTYLMQFSALPSGPGRRGAFGSLAAAREGAGDAEGGAMI